MYLMHIYNINVLIPKEVWPQTCVIDQKMHLTRFWHDLPILKDSKKEKSQRERKIPSRSFTRLRLFVH